MADPEAILPTTYVYGPHILGQVAPGQFPIGFPPNQAPVSLSGLPIQINAFANQAASSTIFLAGSKLHQNQGQEEAGAGIPSPVNNSGDWRPTTAQKRQRTESASDPTHQVRYTYYCVEYPFTGMRTINCIKIANNSYYAYADHEASL